MKTYQNFLLICICSSLLLGCMGGQQKTLGQLKYTEEKETKIEFEKLDHKQVRAEYQDLLDVFEDKKLKEQIERRIADVYMIEGTHNMAQAQAQPSYYLDAIKAYRNILDKYPDSPDNADVMYQLSKAYDMEGRQDEAMTMLNQLTRYHPNYVNSAEVHFRKGDIYFGRKDYVNAIASYNAVTQLGNSKYLLNAHYMLGWAFYKQSQYRTSFKQFYYVLDELANGQETLDHLSKGQKPLATDAIDSMSLALDKIGGADLIASFDGLNKKPYVWLVYQDLGEYYRDKELYELSAQTFRLFLNANPESLRAPEFHQRLITTYEKGAFPHLALKEKEAFATAYGIDSKYAAIHGISDTVSASLKVYLDELARFEYTQGKKYVDNIDKLHALKHPNSEKIIAAEQQKREAFTRAARFYGEYLNTFADDARFNEVVYLRAESLFLAEAYSLAIKDYETVAYTPKKFGKLGINMPYKQADAGYAAIVCFQKHIALLGDQVEQQKEWQEQAVESMLRFANKFDADERSPVVLTNTAEYLFGLNRFQRALEVSQNLINDNPQLDVTLKKTAYGIIAHSYFKLNSFDLAEQNYIAQRQLVEANSDEYTRISERLAATLYKNAEQKIAAEDNAAAIDYLLKLKTLTPDSPVRQVAQYDAASLLLEEKRWPDAIAELLELKRLYPKHELAAEFPRKLAFAYREDKQWLKAANAYLYLYEHDADSEIKREALFICAEMFEQNMSYDTAITYFKRYAYLYEQPFGQRMEARYKLALIYERINEPGKHLYWLRRLKAGNAEAGAQQTDRSRWLAAWANSKYGDYYAAEYRARRLSLPLVKSFASKKQKLDLAAASYQNAADFGFLEFTTMSAVKVAVLYQELAVALEKSPRPKGMSQGDRQSYNQILTQQAQPLYELAADLYLANVERAWQGQYNEWIEKSFSALKKLQPERFDKQELLVSYGDEIR